MYEKSSTFAIWKGYTAARGLKIEYVRVLGTLPIALELQIPTPTFWSRKAQSLLEILGKRSGNTDTGVYFRESDQKAVIQY